MYSVGYSKVQFQVVILASCILTALALSSCNKTEGVKLAEVDGIPITSVDLEKQAGKELFDQRERLYRLEKQKLDEYIGAVLLTREARKQKVSVATLLDQQVNTKVLPVSEGEVEAFYKANKSRIPVELEQVKDQIRDHLHGRKIEAQKALYFKSLRENAKIVTYLKRPPVFRTDISIAGAPFKGPAKAPVTIVKFEDFQCPYCKQIQTTFAEVLARYDGKVRLVHKDLPLDSLHPQARQAAEAARCASDQGKFWEYHDMLYARAPEADTVALKSYAKELGLDFKSFDLCLSSGKYKAIVQQELNEAAGLGITGTPTFFINGRELSGAQPLEVFTALIDEELAQGKSAAPRN